MILTLPREDRGGFLVPRDGLLPYPLGRGSSGHVSPGVPCPSAEGEVVPLCPRVQEFQGFEQDVERGIVVPVKDESASGADVRPHREGRAFRSACSWSIAGW